MYNWIILQKSKQNYSPSSKQCLSVSRSWWSQIIRLAKPMTRAASFFIQIIIQFSRWKNILERLRFCKWKKEHIKLIILSIQNRNVFNWRSLLNLRKIVFKFEYIGYHSPSCNTQWTTSQLTNNIDNFNWQRRLLVSCTRWLFCIQNISKLRNVKSAGDLTAVTHDNVSVSTIQLWNTVCRHMEIRSK